MPIFKLPDRPMVTREVKAKTLEKYVADQLATGSTRISEIVSRRIQVELGRLFLNTPEEFALEKIESQARERKEVWNWDPGGVAWPVADRILAAHIKSYLARRGSRVVIQDFESTKLDPIFKDDPLRSFYNGHTHWELQGTDIPLDKIEECIGDASLWPWLCYFCKERSRENRELTDADFEEVAEHLVGVGVQVRR